MLRRTVKIQLIVFLAITLAGVSYVGANYVGLFRGITGNTCTVKADFPDSGGVFTGAEVTYLGVGVGRVGAMHLIDDGVQIDLNLSNCNSPKIPQNTNAAVADRSIIGEQYVNLLPQSDSGPYLGNGSVIPMSASSVPLPPGDLLADLNGFVTTVDTTDLKTTLDELGQAFQGHELALGQLVDSSNQLVDEAQTNLPQTLDLINKAKGVLNTQLDEADSLKTFAHSIDLLSQQLKTSNPDLQRLLNQSPSDLDSLQKFIITNRTDLGVLLSDLSVTGDLMVRRIPDIREVLILYPLLPGGAMSAIGEDGVAKTALVPNSDDPPNCTSGYGGTVHHSPTYTGNPNPNLSAHCSPTNGNTEVRGSQNVPDPAPMATGG